MSRKAWDRSPRLGGFETAMYSSQSGFSQARQRGADWVRNWVRIGLRQARGSLTEVHCCLESA